MVDEDKHEHEHAEDEACDCDDHEGHEGHDHEGHDHDDEHEGHDHDDEHEHTHVILASALEESNGAIEVNEHEEGTLIASGTLSLMGADLEVISDKLAAELAAVAQKVEDAGGIIGHLKATIARTDIRMLSTTLAGGEVHVKVSPEAEIQVNLVLIVFLVDKTELQGWAEQVMAALQG